MPPPGGGGPLEEPQWFGTAFFALIILSFIPGPWQIITNPILQLFNLFFLFKLAIPLLGIAALFGFQQWFNFTTAESFCPNCRTPQRAPKNEPFQCIACGEELEFNEDSETFVPYKKSGQVPGSTFEQFGDFVKKAATKVQSSTTASSSRSSPSPGGGPGGGPPGPPGRTKNVEVVDAEVL